QRYWGEPFPIVHLEDEGALPLPEELLPLELPQVDEFRPTEDGRPPLARAGEEWLGVELPDGSFAYRETNTMPQWAGSCWYYLRYLDARNDQEPWRRDLENYWMPVDLYVGGVEHAVLHLLYARFWHKVLYDCGLVSTREPFKRLFNQGMILAPSFRDERGKYFAREELKERGGKLYPPDSDAPVIVQVEKMAKSKLNGVDPMEVIERYGADSVRLYELFMGPLEQAKPWQMEGLEGIYRFLARTWRLVVDPANGELSPRLTEAPGDSEPELFRSLHRTLKKVAEDTEALRFNTAISQMMIFVNDATAAASLPRETMKLFVQALSPYAAHLAEELWQLLGGEGLVCQTTWPEHDEALCAEDTITVVVQVNGKV
ncbi:MAG: class I tRNA ligase family protein, partial [Acidobacteria bacterium]|nr:class I tRNA ligase family protein [Acidobacteriota bacterium]